MSARWRYTFRDSDGSWHQDDIRAHGRDAAFALLKERGIRPVRLELVPGFLNRLSALGRRWLAIVALALALAASIAYSVFMHRNVAPAVQPNGQPAVTAAVPRHQILALPDNWVHRLSEYFSPTDSYLALFAQPACEAGLEIIPGPDVFTVDSFQESSLPLDPSAPQWVAELGSILVGMKEEALALARDGKQPAEIIRWLRERQKMEAAYRDQILYGRGSDDEKRQRLDALGLLPPSNN